MHGTAETYDELPYTGHAYWFSHPDHLGLFGAMHGLQTARAAECRVLEIACGDGGNILSIAAALPGATCVGLDLSRVQIDMGRRVAADAGLTNVTLHHADLTTFEVAPASFDYVIAHGLYSWVPEPVRDALLALVTRALAPHGVAVVSYNALPGQSAFEAVRQLMRFHTGPLPDPELKVRQARAIGQAWCDHFVATDPHGRGPLAERVARALDRTSNTLMRHDYLSEQESPSLFTDFVAHAARHGLAYLDNALASAQRIDLLEPEATAMLERLGDPLRVQQYFDFFDETRFRVTLLAHHDAPRGPPLALETLWLEDRLHVDRLAEVTTPTPRVLVETPTGQRELDDLPARVALGVIVGKAPRPVAMTELRDTVMDLLGIARDARSDDAVLHHLCAVFTELWRRDVVHRWREPPPALARDPDRPETGRLQRVLAARGVTPPNLYHRHSDLTAPEVELLAALDGTLDTAALVARFGPDTPATLHALRGKRMLHHHRAAAPAPQATP